MPDPVTDTATARMRERVEALRRELAAGQDQLRALDLRRSELEHTLLRISGAIQVLEELLTEDGRG